ERTRGHQKKLLYRSFPPRCQKIFFNNEVVADWNRLPQSLIDSPNMCVFKSRLDL
ncbi:hypothetical protein HELRODRAFT_136290, partial [Helobdella robusta]|uniref:Uncharacterized protein n=1 Tax=Helobdella robusta TaxID=6412 RepID=T1EID1_HELRO